MSYATLQDPSFTTFPPLDHDKYAPKHSETHSYPLSPSPSYPSSLLSRSGYNHTPHSEINCHLSISPVDDQSISSDSHQSFDFQRTQRPGISRSTMSPQLEFPQPHMSYEYSFNMDNLECYTTAYMEGSYSSPSPTNSDGSYSREDTPGPSDEETEKWLRKNLSIPEPMPLNLWSLPDHIPDHKTPKISDLIKLAIWGSKEHKLTLRQIYAAIEERYPSLKRQKDKPWQRSIRHNLSLKALFVRVERPPGHPGKGYYWKLDVRMGDSTSRYRKRLADHYYAPSYCKEEEDSSSSLSDISPESTMSGYGHPSCSFGQRPDVTMYSLVSTAAYHRHGNISPGSMPQSTTMFDFPPSSSNGYAGIPLSSGLVSPSMYDQPIGFDHMVLDPLATVPPQQTQWFDRQCETSAGMYHPQRHALASRDSRAVRGPRNFSYPRTTLPGGLAHNRRLI